MKVSRLVQGAMIAAVYGALAVVNTYTGSMFDLLMCYFMTVPYAWFTAKYSLKDAVAASVATAAVVMIAGIPSFMIYALTSCVFGMFVGECIRRKTSDEVIMMGGFLVSFINIFLVYVVFAKLFGIDMQAEITELYNDMTFLHNMYSLDNVLGMIPLIMIGLSIMQGYVTLLICQAFLPRQPFKMEFPNDFHIINFDMNKKVAYILGIIAIICLILQNIFHLNYIYITYIFFFCMMAYMIQGMGCAATTLIIYGHPKLSGIVFLMMFIPFINYGLILLGILDIVIDLRKKIVYNRVNQR